MCFNGSESIVKSQSGMGQDYRQSDCSGNAQKQDQQHLGWQCLATRVDAHVKTRVQWGCQTA